MDIEILYKDKYFNYDYEVYKIIVNPDGIKRELIGDTIYWTSYNNKNNNDTFIVLKNGIHVKEEEDNDEDNKHGEDDKHDEDDQHDQHDEDDEHDEHDQHDYNSDGTELLYSSDEEEVVVQNPLCKRTTGFLVFASENKKDKTDLTVMTLGPINSSIIDINKMTELGEMWKALSEEDHINYAKKAQLINNHYLEFVDVNLD
jgi:hypothetical protein